MTYTQKYTLVYFISHTEIGSQFHMSSWPLHTTLADVFAINRQDSDIDNKLSIFCQEVSKIETTALSDSLLGTIAVTLLEKSSKLSILHNNLINLLEVNGAVFNTPEFNRGGFIPHCTIQKNDRVKIGQNLTINSLSLIDMFPDNDWQQRKVLATFNFRSNNF